MDLVPDLFFNRSETKKSELPRTNLHHDGRQDGRVWVRKCDVRSVMYSGKARLVILTRSSTPP